MSGKGRIKKKGDEGMKRKERKLTKLILGALLASGAMFAPSAEAANVAVATKTTINDDTHSNDTLVVSAPSIALTIANSGKIKSILTNDPSYIGNTITVQGTITGGGVVTPLYAITGGAGDTKVYIQDGANVTGYISLDGNIRFLMPFGKTSNKAQMFGA